MVEVSKKIKIVNNLFSLFRWSLYTLAVNFKVLITATVHGRRPRKNIFSSDLFHQKAADAIIRMILFRITGFYRIADIRRTRIVRHDSPLISLNTDYNLPRENSQELRPESNTVFRNRKCLRQHAWHEFFSFIVKK